MPLHILTHRLWPRRLLSLAAAGGLAVAALLGLRALAEAAAPRPAPAAPSNDYAVNILIDAPDFSPGDGKCSTTATNNFCPLRAAIEEINAEPGPGGDVVLGNFTYVLTDTADGDLQIKKNINIRGVDSTIQGGPGWSARILRVQNGAHLGLSNLTVKGGNVPAGFGGGIDVVSGTLTLDSVIVANNTAANGGGIYNKGEVEATDTTIRANHAISNGAGIFNDVTTETGGIGTLTHTVLFSNTAGDTGGGVYNLGGLVVQSSTVALNVAKIGGGLFNTFTGTLSIVNSTVSQNHASQLYGGVGNNAATALTVIINSTIDGNSADSNGGGVGGIGHLTITNVTVSSNLADADHNGSGDGGGLYSTVPNAIYLINTLVAQNVDSGGQAPDCSGTINSGGFNLVQNSTGCPITTTDNLIGANPNLLPLGNYGGPTATRALPRNSPAVDAGDPVGCAFGHNLLLTDQRGLPRAVDGNGDGVARCDIGAFELQVRLFLPVLMR